MGSIATHGQKVPQWVEHSQSTALEIMERDLEVPWSRRKKFLSQGTKDGSGRLAVVGGAQFHPHCHLCVRVTGLT